MWRCVDRASTEILEEPTADAGNTLADLFTLKLETILSSKTSVDARSTQRHIPEDDILHK
jgi:hypothetical protein